MPMYGPGQIDLRGQIRRANTFVPVIGTPIISALGTARLFSNYSGPLMRTVRRSDSATLSIYPQSNRQADVSALPAFVIGTTNGVDTWYDQSGNSNDYVQPTDSSRPTIYPANAVGNIQPISFGLITTGSTAGGIQTTLLSNASINTTRNSVTRIVALALGGGRFNSEGIWTLGNDAVTVGNNLQLLYDTSSNLYPVYNAFGSGKIPQSAQLCVISTVASGSSIKVYLNGVLQATSSGLTTLTLTESRIGSGRWTAQQGAPSDFAADLLYNGVVSDSDRTSIENALMSIFNIPSTYTKNLVFDGDSLTCGLNESGYNRNLVRQTIPNIGSGVFTPNFGISGQVSSSIYTRRASTFAVTTRAKNVLHAWMGTNDIDAGTAAATFWAASILPYIQAAQVAGWNVIVATCIPRGWTTTVGTVAAKETERQNLNSLIMSNASTYNYAVANYGAIAALTTGAANNPPNASYYGQSTSVHLNPTGYGLCAALLAPIAQGMLA